jgi:hypothetical protein
MSHYANAVLDPPVRSGDDIDWVVIGRPVDVCVPPLKARGHGRDRYFLVPADELTPLGPEPAQRLPSVDEIID